MILLLCPMRVRCGGWWWRWRCCLAGRLLRGSALLPRHSSGCEAADSFHQNSRLVPAFQPEQAAPAPARHHLLISAAQSWRDAIADYTTVYSVAVCPLQISIPAACGGARWAGPVRRNSRRGGTSRPHIQHTAASPQLSLTSITAVGDTDICRISNYLHSIETYYITSQHPSCCVSDM